MKFVFTHWEILLNGKFRFIYLKSILDTLAPNQTNYIFFKYIDYWEHSEKVINSLVLQENIDLYVVTTNNDSLMELFTKAFPGNYVSYVAS